MLGVRTARADAVDEDPRRKGMERGSVKMYKTKFRLRDVLELLLGSSEPLPDEWKKGYEDIRPDSSYMVRLCFMCEEETWVRTYPAHPLLIPWYDCMVKAISPEGDDELAIWLEYVPFLNNMIGWKVPNNDAGNSPV